MSTLKGCISSILTKIAVGGSDNGGDKAMMDRIRNTGATKQRPTTSLQSMSSPPPRRTSPRRHRSRDAMAGGANRQLDDKQAEATSLGIGIGAASLQPLVATLYQHTR